MYPLMDIYELAAWTSVFMIIFMAMMVPVIAFILFCMARVFMKAGQPWWKAIIPVYNEWTESRVVAKAHPVLCVFYVALLAFSYVYMIVMMFPQYWVFYYETSMYSLTGALLWMLFLTVWYVPLFILYIFVMIRLAKSFGQSGGFAVGLILLYPVFIAILAFNSSIQYQKAPDMQGQTPQQYNPYGQVPPQQPAQYNPYGQAPQQAAQPNPYGQVPPPQAPVPQENPVQAHDQQSPQ